ncbi:hypothetical protein QFZ50_000516 [Arthrobacter agilis]|nr:hypothetical protein [Arthrobacter agilis]
MDSDIHLDLLAAADGQEVEVLDDALELVALDVLDEGQVVLAVDVQRQQGVRGADGQRGGLGGQQDVDGIRAVAVDDRGDHVGAAGLASRTLAEFGADVCCELLLGHSFS